MHGRILIIDGVATNRIVLKVKLATASYESVQAEDISVARDLIAKAIPGMVIVSSVLPDGDGIEFCRKFKASAEFAGVPVVVTGRRGDPDLRARALEAGADEFLATPLDENELLARVRRLFRRRASSELYGTTGPVSALGLAEPAGGYRGPGLIATVADDPRRALALKSLLSGRMRDRLTAKTHFTVLQSARSGPVPDLYVIEAGMAPMRDLRLIAELRARTESESAAIVVLVDRKDSDFITMALDLGAADVVDATASGDEIAMRLRHQLRLKQDEDRQLRTVREGLKLATTDALTGLMNRRASFARLDQIAGAAGEGGSFAVMVLDIDRFKDVNDRFGHPAGDAVLAEVARRLQANMRNHDTLGRIGGEEFLVVLPGAGLVPARLAAERLRRAVEMAPIEVPDGGQVFVTISIGLAIGCGAVQDRSGAGQAGEQASQVALPALGDPIFSAADQALMSAKAHGRNKVTVSRSVA